MSPIGDREAGQASRSSKTSHEETEKHKPLENSQDSDIVVRKLTLKTVSISDSGSEAEENYMLSGFYGTLQGFQIYVNDFFEDLEGCDIYQFHSNKFNIVISRKPSRDKFCYSAFPIITEHQTHKLYRFATDQPRTSFEIGRNDDGYVYDARNPHFQRIDFFGREMN